jgi:hypothetical protein
MVTPATEPLLSEVSAHCDATAHRQDKRDVVAGHECRVGRCDHLHDRIANHDTKARVLAKEGAACDPASYAIVIIAA